MGWNKKKISVLLVAVLLIVEIGFCGSVSGEDMDNLDVNAINRLDVASEWILCNGLQAITIGSQYLTDKLVKSFFVRLQVEVKSIKDVSKVGFRIASRGFEYDVIPLKTDTVSRKRFYLWVIQKTSGQHSPFLRDSEFFVVKLDNTNLDCAQLIVKKSDKFISSYEEDGVEILKSYRSELNLAYMLKPTEFPSNFTGTIFEGVSVIFEPGVGYREIP